MTALLPCVSTLPRLSPNGHSPDDENDYEEPLSEEEAVVQAIDDVERDGYAIAWALQDICLDSPEGPVGAGVWMDRDFCAQDHTSQTLLAAVFNASGPNRDAALHELRERIRKHETWNEAINERRDELMGEA